MVTVLALAPPIRQRCIPQYSDKKMGHRLSIFTFRLQKYKFTAETMEDEYFFFNQPISPHKASLNILAFLFEFSWIFHYESHGQKPMWSGTEES